MIAVMYRAGVTSKAGFQAGKRSETSFPFRSSIGIASPFGQARSTVDVGAAI